MSFADIRPEIPRTFFHILGGLFLAWVGFFISPPLNRVALGVIFCAALSFELIRLLVPKVNQLVKVVVGPFMRPQEEKGLTGAPAFTGGVFLTFLTSVVIFLPRSRLTCRSSPVPMTTAAGRNTRTAPQR